jgi:hypothetical protein
MLISLLDWNEDSTVESTDRLNSTNIHPRGQPRQVASSAQQTSTNHQRKYSADARYGNSGTVRASGYASQSRDRVNSLQNTGK